MRGTLIFFFLVFLSANCVAQKNSSIDLILSVDYSFRSIDEDGGIGALIAEVREKENGIISWRGGFNFNRSLSERFILKTGLRFASLGYASESNDTLRFGNQHDGNGGFVDPDPTNSSFVQIKDNYYFLEVPVMLRWEHQKRKRWNTFLEGGLSAMYYLTTRTMIDFGEERSVDHNRFTQDNFNDLQIAANVAFGVNYTPNENWQIFGQPIFRYHLSKMFRETFINENLWSAGVEIGFRKIL